MEDQSKRQVRRAENIIWNAAGDHDFRPDFKALDREGQAQLYWNIILGAARKHYDYPRLQELFRTLDLYEEGDTYEGLLWLSLEGAIYEKELPFRPVLSELRQEHARAVVEQLTHLQDEAIYDHLALGHFRRALGEDCGLDGYAAELLDQIEIGPELDTQAAIDNFLALMERWFQLKIRPGMEPRRRRANILGKKPGKLSRGKGTKPFAFSFLQHSKGDYGGSALGRQRQALPTKLSAEELRAFMESKFGGSIYSPQDQAQLERKLCTLGHSHCHLLITRGEPVKGSIQNAFEALQKEREAAQIQRNKDSFYRDLSRNRTVILKLTERIRSSVLLYLDPDDAKTDSGTLVGELAWRAPVLEDGRVFVKSQKGDRGSLSVDILLDASTSQKGRQEQISTQGYIIAESLGRCGIPCRVMSFCSMTGFTVLRIFTDHQDRGKNEKIFDYVSNGCNRDGLAIRAAHHLMSADPYEHKVLIVLSDVKPNDVIKLCDRQGHELGAYEDRAGLLDTALEVRRARAEGIAVLCVFTGADQDLPSARLVYGRDLARIGSLDRFADTVGMLIQNQLKLMGG